MICTNGPERSGVSGGIPADRKALLINLDKGIFGTFAEIGAGQEVARQFFRVGGAANTIAKTMSAYDMTFSDAIYGKATRYVSKERLVAMLDHEYGLLTERLAHKRGEDTQFFAFADTVATRGFKGHCGSHGWLGIRFQPLPLSAPSDIRLHVRMLDSDTLAQQEALGIVGVNLIFAAFHFATDHERLIASLLDGLTAERIEIDMLELSGPAFDGVDPRLVSIALLKKGLTRAVLLPPDGSVRQPQEILYNHRLLVLRGRFQPVTAMHVDMVEQARKRIGEAPTPPLVLCEITLHNASAITQLTESQILAQADELKALGFIVMITIYPEFHRVAGFLRRCTQGEIFFVAGVDTLVKLHQERYYTDLEGGMLEALGKLFHDKVKLLVYPMLRERLLGVLARAGVTYPEDSVSALPEVVTTVDIGIDPHFGVLLGYLRQARMLEDISAGDPALLAIDTADVLRKLRENDPAWEASVPKPVKELIRRHRAVYATGTT